MSKEIEFLFDSPEDSPGYLLGQLTMLWQRRLKKVLDPLDLTQTQFVLLAALGWLAKTKESVTQADIAKQSNADKMMVSKVLRTLVDKGLITREEHHIDTRAKHIQLTAHGEAVLQTALGLVENTDQDFFDLPEHALLFLNKSLAQLIHKNSKNTD